MIELYAIADDAGPPPEPGLRAVPCAGLAAIVGDAEEQEPTFEVLWRHEELVERLNAQRDLLPVRFGTRFASDAEAAREVAARREELAAALEHVRGATELSVRAALSDVADDAVSESGVEYLRARSRAEGERGRARSVLHEPLSALARSAVERPPQPPVEVLRAAYLVDRDGVERFTREVAALQSAHPELQILCTGPWPPYSFTER